MKRSVLKEYTRKHLIAHGPSKWRDIYDGFPDAVKGALTPAGYNSALHDMHSFVNEKGVVRLPSQPVDPRKLYNDYVWELLEIACRKGEISVSDIEGTGVENGEATRRFRYLQNNDLIARANSCGRSKKSFYTLTQRAMNIMESARKLESVASLS